MSKINQSSTVNQQRISARWNQLKKQSEYKGEVVVCRNAAECESLGHRPRNLAISTMTALKGRNCEHDHFAPSGNVVTDFFRKKAGLVKGIAGESILSLSHECGGRL